MLVDQFQTPKSAKVELRTTIINQMSVIAYRFGFSDQTIARLYRGEPQKQNRKKASPLLH